MESKAFRRRQLATLLLDQAFGAGLGNYLRSEVLFFAGLSPRARPADLEPAARKRLAKAICDVARRAYRRNGVTNAPDVVRELKAGGAAAGTAGRSSAATAVPVTHAIRRSSASRSAGGSTSARRANPDDACVPSPGCVTVASLAKRSTLDPQDVAILWLLSEGRSETEILEAHPEIERADIARAARRALEVAVQAPAFSVTEIRKQHPRAYEKWSEDEERRLLALYKSGESIGEIAEAFRRQPGAIRSRLNRLLGEPEAVAAPEPESRVREPEPAHAGGAACRRCGGAIPKTRLDAVPGTTLCVRCKELEESPEDEERLVCPRCGSPLVWKQPRDPEETRYFLACSAYPDCWYIDSSTGLGFKR